MAATCMPLCGQLEKLTLRVSSCSRSSQKTTRMRRMDGRSVLLLLLLARSASLARHPRTVSAVPTSDVASSLPPPATSAPPPVPSVTSPATKTALTPAPSLVASTTAAPKTTKKPPRPRPSVVPANKRQPTTMSPRAGPDMKCYTEAEAEEFCSQKAANMSLMDNQVNKTEVPKELDLIQFINNFNNTAIEMSNMTSNASGADWRSGSLKDRNRVLLERRLYTDCTFVVGPDNNTQEVAAHRVFLAGASPVFEAALAGGQHIRVRDVTPESFSKMIEFVYTGGVCLTSFSEACELVGVATRLQVDQLARQSRAFLWSSLHPGNVWKALQCAHRHRDNDLELAAMQMIQWKTEQSLKDPQFVEIPQSSLVSLLQQDTLSVSSELVLFDASLRWAMAEAKRRGLPQEPEVLKEVLGPTLGFIRFLTLTPRQFTDLHSTSKILSYPESLAVIFNINSPGVMEMPANLSSSNQSRVTTKKPSTFDVLESSAELETCTSDTNIFNPFTSQLVRLDRTLRLIGVEIPSQVECKDGPKYTEDLTVQVLHQDAVLHSTRFKNQASCDSLIKIRFTEKFSLTYNKSAPVESGPRLKVTFHKSGRYPGSWTKDTQSLRKGARPRADTLDNVRVYYWYFGDNDFFFSMISDTT